jgi:carbamate kinase
MPGTIVVALGGNAILQPGQKGTFEEQMENVKITASQLARLIVKGNRLVITHGNGPQVGRILQQQSMGEYGGIPPMPLFVCGAMSQGMIGYMVQQALYNEFRKLGIDRTVVTLVSQVIVDTKDPAFSNPTKPIGAFYSQQEAMKAQKDRGEVWKEDSGRGWRRVVPSPPPGGLLEISAVKALINHGAVVIASGGGGIPVAVRDTGEVTGIDAVIDKDLAAEKLAEEVDADVLLILTDVSHVAINYKTHLQQNLTAVTAEELSDYYEQGHFKAGSMGPKVKAALKFVENGGRMAVITSLDNALLGAEGRAGTVVTRKAVVENIAGI